MQDRTTTALTTHMSKLQARTHISIANEMLMIPRLLVCITFHYSETRIPILKKTCSRLGELAEEVNVVILTNEESNIPSLLRELETTSYQLKILAPKLLGHPYLLTWCHQQIFRDRIKEDTTTSHFMYIEDDIVITPENIEYWLEGREVLRNIGLIPSFLRYERSSRNSKLFATDLTRKVNPLITPKAYVDSKEYAYMNLPQPYQGMYLLDRELIEEHLNCGSSSPDFGSWPIREKATQGITFLNVPRPFSSRNVIGYSISTQAIDKRSLIHHAANNYVDDPGSQLGKVPIDTLFNVYSWRWNYVLAFLGDQIGLLLKGRERNERSLRRLRRRKC